MTSPTHHRIRVTGWATAGLLVLQLGWLLVLPPATGIDEFDHLYRASAVALGHWQPGSDEVAPFLARGAMLPVRADIAEIAGPACAELKYTRPFNCRPYHDRGDGVVEIASGVDYYNPLYYGVVGTLARPFTGNGAVVAVRAASALVCAAMFGLAVFLTMGWARGRWPLVLLLASCLPTTVYSASIATPNGVQMVSGILVWAAVIALLRDGVRSRALAYTGLMTAVGLMANTHTLGLLWIGLVGLSMIVYAGLTRTLALVRPRNRLEFLALGLAVLAVVFQLWWTAYARPNLSRPEGGLTGSPWRNIAQGVILWTLQAVAAFPYRNESAPGVVYGIAFVVLLTLAVLTARALRGRRRLAVTLGVALFVTVAVPVGTTYAGYHQFGMSWQGRYGMPYSVGIFALAALALDDHGPSLRGPFLWLGTIAWGLAQTIGLTHVLAIKRTDHALIAATNWWAPPLGLAIALGAIATAMWLRSVFLARGVREVSGPQTGWLPDHTGGDVLPVR